LSTGLSEVFGRPKVDQFYGHGKDGLSDHRADRRDGLATCH
jgi:hypothetical protein